MAALMAGSYVGPVGALSVRPVMPTVAARTGANVRGAVLDQYLGQGVVDVPVIRLSGGLGDGVNVCTDAGWRAAFATGSSLIDAIGAAITASAGSSTAQGYDAGRATAGRLTSAAGATAATAYMGACAPAPGTAATTATPGSPTNAEITAELEAARNALATARADATTSEAARAREAAAAQARTNQYLMIGGGVALAALAAYVLLRK